MKGRVHKPNVQMKFFLRINILLLIMTLSSITSKAGYYSREWKKVNAEIKADLPEKALNLVRQIYEYADSSNDEYQMLKSTVMMTKLESTFQEENFTIAIERLNLLLPRLTEERINICQALIGNCYREYFDKNYWSILENPVSDSNTSDYTLWDSKTFFDTISYHLLRSVTINTDCCIKAQLKQYDEIITIGNKSGRELRPTLLDILLFNALWDGMRIAKTPSEAALLEKVSLYGTSEDFLETIKDISTNSPGYWNYKILQLLTERHLKSNSDIRASIDSRRIDIIESEEAQNPEDLLGGRIKLGEYYFKSTSASTDFMADAARSLYESKKAIDALSLCQKAIKAYPKSIGGVECANIAKEIKSKEVHIDIWGDLATDTLNISRISYRNATDIYFKIISVPEEIQLYGEEMIDTLNSINTVTSWHHCFNKYEDYLSHSTYFTIPALKAGSYYIIASTDSLFSKTEQVSYLFAEVSDISFIKRVFNSSSITGYTVNSTSGEPIPNCEYTIWRIDNKDDDNAKKALMKGSSDINGLIHVEGMPNGNYQIELNNQISRKTISLYLPYRSDIPLPLITRIYSDRYSYQPGDSIQFCGIIYSSNGYSIGKVNEDIPLKITLYDANWQPVDSLKLTSNEFGSVSGSLNIPRNALPGRFTIHIEGQDEYVSSNRTINVESYSQPTFNISFLPDEQLHHPDVPIKITGKAITLTGLPVNGAKVNYTVDYQRSPIIIYRRLNTQVNNITSGETETDKDGCFSIPFTILSDRDLLKEENNITITIKARITDLNGETHEGSTIIVVGRQDREINVNIKESYISDPSFKMSLRNLSGNPVSGKVNVEICKLSQPTKVCLNIPELLSLDDHDTVNESIKKAFPLYDFTHETDKTTWEVEKNILSQDLIIDTDNLNELQLPHIENGTYRITVTSADADTLISDFIVSNSDSDIMPDNSQLIAIGNKDTYRVGDTAIIRIGSFIPNNTVYYIIENRFGDSSHGIINIDGKLETLQIPITEELLGGFSVNLCTIRDRVASNKTLSFDVPYIDKELKMTLVTFREIIEPNKKESWKLSVRDHNDQPVSASLILSMYDSALDSYGTNDWIFSPWNGIMFNMSPLFEQNIRPSSYYQLYTQPKPFKGKPVIYGSIASLFDYYPSNGKEFMRANNFKYLSVMTKDAVFATGGIVEIVEDDDIVLAETALSVEEGVETKSYSGNTDKIILRTDNNPTAFFISTVNTSEDGYYNLNFTAPQLLTRWNLKGLAYTTDLKHGELLQNIITRKELMLEPAAPRFLRQGDVIDFTSKVSNLTDASTEATVRLEITDAISGKPLHLIEGDKSVKVVIPAGLSNNVTFRLNIPNNISALTYTITATTGTHSDGQRETLPVLSNRTRIVQSISLFNNGNETRTFELDKIKNMQSPTVSDEKLTLEYSSNPIWYVIQALPYLEENTDPTNERLYHRFMANSLSSFIVSHNPDISKMLSSWSKQPIGTWQTQLEKNQDLKQTLLEETPWVLESNNEKENLRRLAKAFNRQSLKLEYTALLNQLLTAQEPDGGWAWIKGYESSTYTTTMIVNGVGMLYESFAVNLGKEKKLKFAIMNAINYLDSCYYSEYVNRDKEEKSISYPVLSYLLARSYFRNCLFLNKTNESFDYYMKLAENIDTHNLDLYYRAALSLLLSRTGKQDIAENVINTVMDRSLYDEQQGRYWRDNTGGYLWHQAPIETQSLIIGALASLPGHKKEITECQRWLLKQRQTTHWATAPSTAKAVMALLINGNQPLQDTIPVNITIGNETITATPDNTNGGYMRKTWEEPIRPEMTDITVSTKSKNISWGAFYLQYTEDMEKVSSLSTGLTISRTLHKVIRDSQGDKLQQIDDNTQYLQVGDRVRVRMQISTDRNLEFVQIKDMRAASLEPVSTSAGIRYNFADDLRYYIAPRENSTLIYIDRISKGSYIVEYDLFVQKSGTYQIGTATIQCMYAPEFRANTASRKITVK